MRSGELNETANKYVYINNIIINVEKWAKLLEEQNQGQLPQRAKKEARLTKLQLSLTTGIISTSLTPLSNHSNPRSTGATAAVNQ